MGKSKPMDLSFRFLKENMEVSDSPQFNSCENCGGEGKLSHTNSKGVDVYGEGGQMCDDCEGTGYMKQNNRSFAAMQQKLTGEPMDLAFRLLKGAPVPDWAQQNNPNRSDFKGSEDYRQNTGGDAYTSTYGGKPVGIQRMPSGDPRDMARVKDLASGTYGGQEYGGQEPGYYTGNPNLTNEKLNAFMAAEEAKKKPQPQPQPQPTTAPPVGQAFNTYQQQQPQQVQTGEPMNLAFRLLKAV